MTPPFIGGRRDDQAARGPLTGPVDRLIAEVCVFLASKAASYVNGAVIPVDAGFWITKTGGGSPLLR